MCINNASMCTNVTRGSQYIVMHNTGVTDLEISEQIDIMKVDDVLNISCEYSYIHKHFRYLSFIAKFGLWNISAELSYRIFIMNICVEYLRQGGRYKVNFHPEEYFCGIFTMNISAKYFCSLYKCRNFNFPLQMFLQNIYVFKFTDQIHC